MVEDDFVITVLSIVEGEKKRNGLWVAVRETKML
jgi:DNA-binding cell septation regulator SpoVG